MQSVDHEVLGQLAEWLSAGQTAWLCTIVRTYGSSPRPAGSLLACNEHGQVVGSLSGGCVEDELIEQLQAGECARSGPELLSYGIRAEDTERLGLPCGGQLEIVVEALTPEHAPLFGDIVRALEARRCIRRKVELWPGGTMSATASDHHGPLELEQAGSQGPRLQQTYGPRRQLFLIGAGMVSRYLAEMAQALDYQVTVCDPREHMLEAWHVPGTRVLCAMPDDAVREHANDPHSAIIALTHDPRIDDMGLMEALCGDAWYIGAMGSTRTSANRRERLRQLDLSAEQIDRLHAPVGLPIGSKTPPEIAIAILAELTALDRERPLDAQRETTTAPANIEGARTAHG